VKTPAIPGETGLGAMRCSHRHVSDDALTASSGPEDAQFRPRIGLPRGLDARRSSGSTSRRAIGRDAPMTSGTYVPSPASSSSWKDTRRTWARSSDPSSTGGRASPPALAPPREISPGSRRPGTSISTLTASTASRSRRVWAAPACVRSVRLLNTGQDEDRCFAPLLSEAHAHQQWHLVRRHVPQPRL